MFRPIFFSHMHNDAVISYNLAAEKALRNINKGKNISADVLEFPIKYIVI